MGHPCVLMQHLGAIHLVLYFSGVGATRFGRTKSGKSEPSNAPPATVKKRRFPASRSRAELLAGVRRHLFVELFLQLLQVEARTLLHRRVIEESLSRLGDFLLNEHKAPELIPPPIDEHY